MFVIPAINCKDFPCVKEKLEKIRAFGAERVHFDISDGRFTDALSWNDPAALKKESLASGLKVEVHLMVKEPEEYLGEWLNIADRIIMHLETIRDSEELLSIHLGRYELGLALNPKTKVSDIFPYLNGERASVKFVQLLAVPPGFSGQKFGERILEKIKILREKFGSEIKIEVDGGINPETAHFAKTVGADISVSSSYLWGSEDAKKAFESLRLL